MRGETLKKSSLEEELTSRESLSDLLGWLSISESAIWSALVEDPSFNYDVGDDLSVRFTSGFIGRQVALKCSFYQADQLYLTRKYYQISHLYLERWYRGGELHRVDEPAVRKFDKHGHLRERIYYREGVPHRVDGPAYESWNHQGKLENAIHYLHGERQSEQDLLQKIQQSAS